MEVMEIVDANEMEEFDEILEPNARIIEPGVQLVMTKAMSIDLILIQVLDYSSSKDLLTLSLVNKRWNLCCRKILREKKKCLAKIYAHKPCEDFFDLNARLETAVEVPFNGLEILLHPVRRRRGCDSEQDHCCREELLGLIAADDPFPQILQRMRLRYLEIHWLTPMECPAVSYLIKLFQRHTGSLKELKIKSYWQIGDINNFFNLNDESRKVWLPRLERLEIPYGLQELLVEAAVGGAPRLSEIYGDIHPRELEILLQQNKGHLIKEFHLSLVPDELPLCYRFAQGQPKLMKLDSSLEGFIPVGLIGEHSELLKLFLQSSSETLETLRIDLLSLAWLSLMGIRELKAVKNLTIAYNITLDQIINGFSLRRINLQVMFPSVEDVTFTYNPLALTPETTETPQGFPPSATFMCISAKRVDATQLPRDLLPHDFFFPIAEYFPAARVETP